MDLRGDGDGIMCHPVRPQWNPSTVPKPWSLEGFKARCETVKPKTRNDSWKINSESTMLGWWFVLMCEFFFNVKKSRWSCFGQICLKENGVNYPVASKRPPRTVPDGFSGSGVKAWWFSSMRRKVRGKWTWMDSKRYPARQKLKWNRCHGWIFCFNGLYMWLSNTYHLIENIMRFIK